MTMETIDRERILMEAHCIELEDAYFGARPQIDCNDRRKVFQAGFERAWQRLAELGVSATAETGRIEQYTDADLTRIYNDANGITDGKSPPITTQRIFAAMRAIASPPLPTKEGWQWVPVEQLNILTQAVIEMRHAFMEPNWFTDGKDGANRQFLLWAQKGIDAAKTLSAAPKP